MPRRSITLKYFVSGLLCSLLPLASCATGTPATFEHAGGAPVQARTRAKRVATQMAAAVRRRARTLPQPEPPVDLAPAEHAADSALADAVRAAGERVDGWWKPLPDQPSYAKLLDPDRQLDAPLSMGTVGTGELLNAVELPPESKYYSVIERHRHHHTQYGTRALVALIKQVARQVAKASPGAKLRLGNMSRKHGGDIPWSSSHNSGRDADLAFFCKRKKDGVSVPAPDLLKFDASGVAIKRPDLVFDVARNWQLVKALLTNGKVGIQWIFVSNGLKKLLLDYARKHGVASELVARAEKVLHQPTDAPPHNDHFHLRITCPLHDRLEGCLDYGPRWTWVNWHYHALLARSMALARAFHAPKVATRVRALDFLDRIRSPFAPELALLAALHDPSDQVRKRALEVAADVPTWSGAAVYEALQFVGQARFSVDEKAYAYSILRRSVDKMALEPLEKRVADTSLSVDERVLAAHALVHYMEPKLVPFLLDQMSSQPPQVAATLAITLRRVTNRSEQMDWSSGDATARSAALGKWKSWWKKHKDFGRDDWLEEGFVAQGFQGKDLFDVNAVADLIGFLHRGPDYVAYNANLTLKRITGRWAPLEAWDNAHLYRYWSRWWRINRSNLVAMR